MTIERVSAYGKDNKVDQFYVAGLDFPVYELDGNGQRLRGPGTVAPQKLPEQYISLVGATATLTNNLQAEGFFNASDSNIWKIDLTGYSQARLTGRVVTVSASVNSPKIYIKYHTAYTATIGTFTAVTSLEFSIFTGATLGDSGWVDLPSGALIQDCFLCLANSGGDGAADPAVANVMLALR
jgi:hypothetical protein